MATYTTNIDICNRALEMIGSKPITAFADGTINANEVSFVYDKLRQAELRRSIWRFATRRTCIRPMDTGTLIFTPPAWASTGVYLNGMIVSYAGVFWVSRLVANYMHTPGTDDTWQPWFGSRSCEAYDTTGGTSYFAGETVYYPAPLDIYLNYYYAFSCLATGTTTDPFTAPAWSASATYNAGQFVTFSGQAYFSTVPLNLNVTPGVINYTIWNSTTSYSSGNTVVDSNTGKLYVSAINANVGNNPVTDSGTNWAAPVAAPFYQPWLATSLPNSDVNWVAQQAGFTMAPPNFVYPINSGPLSLSGTQNVFRLPHGYLRRAPMLPETGQVPFLGGPMWNIADDYQIEGNYFVSNTATPIIFRFVADITNVAEMDPMFCEGLAARIALAVYPRLSQKDAKMPNLMALYKEMMTSARTQNSIETGAIQPAQDTFISCRS